MATSKVEAKAQTGSPAGTVTTPKGTGATVSRAVRAARPGNTPVTLTSLGQAFMKGPPPELTQKQGDARAGYESALTNFESVGAFEPQQFTQKRPTFDRQAIARTLPLLTVMMTLGGRATRGNALGMMKATTAAIKGLEQGNQEVYKRALTDYEANYQEFVERERVRKSIYDFRKEAARDGLQVALARQSAADKAVNDWREDLSGRIDVASTLENSRLSFLKTTAELAERAEKIKTERLQQQAIAAKLAALGTPGAQPTRKLTAKENEQITNAKTLLRNIDSALLLMETRPEDFSTALNTAFVNYPRTTEVVRKGLGIPARAIQSQQTWRNALNIKIVQGAGLSQTVAEATNQLAASGSTTRAGRLTGFANFRVSALKELNEAAKSDSAIAESLRKQFGAPIESVLKDAEDYAEMLGRNFEDPRNEDAPIFQSQAAAKQAEKQGRLRLGQRVIVRNPNRTFSVFEVE